MLNLGLTEIMVVIAITIVVVGPDRLPQVVRWLGRQYGKLMRASDELRQAFVFEADRVEAEHRSDALRKRREEARKRIADAREQGQERTDVPQPRDDSGPRILGAEE